MQDRQSVKLWTPSAVAKYDSLCIQSHKFLTVDSTVLYVHVCVCVWACADEIKACLSKVHQLIKF